ncbi:polysaccharide biosynthesis/export family protein [Sphingomonas tabacisoli]|uniref:Polysaccharide biosynthesis/export family protein n=1 Tax=Sphingomonas tabacisoli TaxID=2249466 RepID=A0ABW4HXH6_9SPHN
MLLFFAAAASAQVRAPAPTGLPPQMQAQIQAQAQGRAPVQPARPPAGETKAQKDLEAGYVLGPDDVVEISVLGQQEFTTRARVKANGTIQLPFIGEQKIEGETALTLAPKIAEKLRAGGYYAKPVVNVEVSGFASRYVVLLGAVNQAGLQPVDRDYRLSEIIARAGGMRADGADFVTLTRANGEQHNYPFEKLASGGPNDDPMVRPGDKIYVPEADLYYIYGQINQPGAFPLRGDMTVRNVIAKSGGVGPSGSIKRIKLFRDGQEQKVNLDMKVKAGDVFFIGERLF